MPACDRAAARHQSVIEITYRPERHRWGKGMLGILVETFGNFVREIHIPPEAIEAQVGCPSGLHDLRDAVGHHLIPLLLLARTDRAFVPSEFDVIVTHCLSFAERRGVNCDGERAAAFRDYVDTFRPALMQLDPAIERLCKCEHGEFVCLVEAAQKLVAADGVSRPEEVAFLAKLQGALDKLAENGAPASA